VKHLGSLSKITIHYNGNPVDVAVQFRNGIRELIVFIHGLGCSKDSFANVWDFADLKKYSLLTLDLVGYGYSSKPLDFSYDIAEQAEICHLVLNHFEFDAIHIVAHSMGGAVGLLLAEK
jgi:pimeloyl-ACP methyl ester carboxylesterase